MAEAGFDTAHIARCLDESWVWRNVVVAETDAEAERIGIPAFEAMQEHRKALRERIYAEQGIIMKKEEVPPARVNPSHALIAGSPATVAAKMAEIEATNDAARLTVALEVYRSVHGRYPADLATLGREGFLPTDETARVVARYFYQTDGVIYSRLER